MIPTSCFEMMESSDVSLYESQTTLCQHVFCATCGKLCFAKCWMREISLEVTHLTYSSMAWLDA